MIDDKKSNPLSDDPFGWVLIVVFSVLLPFPFAVIAHEFGPTIGPPLWLAMVIGFPIWMIWYGSRPYS